MHARNRLALAATGALLVTAVLGGLWLTAGRDADEPGAVDAAGGTATSTGAALPAPSSFPVAPAAPSQAATATATGSPGPSTAGTQVLEPGPDAPVATDVPSGADGIAVVVTYADWVDGGVEVDGYVSGTVEDGGNCRLTLTRGAEVRTVEGPGSADASTTTCGSLVVPGAGLPAGEWSAVLAYGSSSASATSERSVVTVPAR